MVDNGEATLEVGDQIPVSTGSATVLSANNAVVNTVDYKNTGIILHVQPRVNSNGSVLLNIDQEISACATCDLSSTSANLTPTISERKVSSEISVVSGQTVLLAGLIQDEQDKSREGIPILNQLPFAGAAFGTTGKSNTRTELIIFIRPQIIRDGVDASMVAEELRAKMRGGRTASRHIARHAQRSRAAADSDDRTPGGSRFETARHRRSVLDVRRRRVRRSGELRRRRGGSAWRAHACDADPRNRRHRPSRVRSFPTS